MTHAVSEPRSYLCPTRRWVRATCDDHGAARWIAVGCKSRDCPVCGDAGRRRIAERLALGCRQVMERGGRVAWLVLTFDRDVTKPEAVRRLGQFVRYLRRTLGDGIQYAATYELTRKGRLHINLLVTHWSYIRGRTLNAQWGARVSVEIVRSSAAIGAEAAKTYSPEALGGYLSKLYQAVPREWKRRVSYSRGWPKLPESESLPGVSFSIDENPITRDWELRTGNLVETGRNVYKDRRTVRCACYSEWEGPIAGSFDSS